jgi:hypothetical protein
MGNLARKNDPATSKTAAAALVDSGMHGRQKIAAIRLVTKYPGYSFQHLYERHVAECRRRGRSLVFSNSVALMRRLSEVAVKRGTKFCPISGRKVSRWWPS